MISNKKLKEFVKEKSSKRISFEAIEKINKIIQENLERIIKKASLNADFLGRKTIKGEDIKED